jgi:hypothetical protein
MSTAQVETASAGTVASFVEVTKERDELRDQLKAVEERRSAIEAELVEQFALNNVKSIKVPGFTVYMQIDQRITVKGDLRAEAIAAARALELEELIAIQPQRFQAWAKEMIANEGGVPEEFLPLINTYEHASIRCRKS